MFCLYGMIKLVTKFKRSINTFFSFSMSFAYHKYFMLRDSGKKGKIQYQAGKNPEFSWHLTLRNFLCKIIFYMSECKYCEGKTGK